MECIVCGSSNVHKDGIREGYQRYKCLDCGRRFKGEQVEKTIEHIIHFGTKIKKTDFNKLTRENYCIPDKKLDYKSKRNIKLAKNQIERTGKPPILCPSYYYTFPNNVIEDEENFTDEYVEQHYMECMENFDLNMAYFKSLNHDEFDNYLTKFIKKNKFNEVFNLSSLKEIEGVYILVLDDYNQVYIGKSSAQKGIKGRILAHWSKKKEFARLLHGTVETSVLSIDSFGALDTTRIFYKKVEWYQDLDEYEEKIVSKFDSDYCLNRIGGGLNSENNGVLRNLMILGTTRKRKLK